MEWNNSNVRMLPEEEGMVTGVRNVELLEQATNTLPRHINKTVELFIEKLKSEKQIKNTDNAELDKYQLYYLLTTYPELLQSDFAGNTRVRTEKTDAEIADLLANRYAQNKDNKSDVNDKTYLLTLIHNNKADINQIFTLENIVEAELKKLSDTTSKQLSVAQFNDAVSTTMNNIEKVMNMYKPIPETRSCIAKLLHYFNVVIRIRSMMNKMPKQINNINKIKKEKQWPSVKKTIQILANQKAETLENAVNQIDTAFKKLSETMESLSQSRKTVTKTYTNEANTKKYRQNARVAEQKKINNAAARIKYEREEQERKDAAKKRDKEALNAEIAKMKANNNAKEKVRHANLEKKGLLYLEEKRKERIEKEKRAFEAYGPSKEELNEQKAVEEALREKKAKQLAEESGGKTLQERMAAFTTKEQKPPKKLSFSAPVPVINQNYMELLEKFLIWLSTQQQLINRVAIAQKTDFINFIKDTILNKIRSKENFKNDIKANNFLYIIKEYINSKGGVHDILINVWAAENMRELNAAELQFLAATINNSILVQTVRGGANKMLTKRRKISKRLQTKKKHSRG